MVVLALFDIFAFGIIGTGNEFAEFPFSFHQFAGFTFRTFLAGFFRAGQFQPFNRAGP